ncbi:MAG TPA: DUF4396 domain-containing protein [Gaiellales bacterium]|nr:DUF4396 domain-containing protein [Gaiellales bacterium]
MAPHWFELVAWVALALGFASALVIAADIALLGNRQHMAIMNLVFPLTALYMGPVAVWAYFTRGRQMSHRHMHIPAPTARMTNASEPRDSWWQVSLSDSHCGAGCALGDVGGEWIVWAVGWMIGLTAALGPEYILDLPLAWTFGILFQYFVIAPLRGQVGQLAPLGDAIKSETLSVLSFEVGLFGWMALSHYVIWRPEPPIDSSGHWFTMQIGMTLGFLTSWPVNRWLLRKGVKEPMTTAGEAPTTPARLKLYQPRKSQGQRAAARTR